MSHDRDQALGHVGYQNPHDFVAPNKVASTAATVSAARENWAGQDISKTKMSFKKQKIVCLNTDISKKKMTFSKRVLRKLSFLKTFWGKSIIKEENVCIEEDEIKKDKDSDSNGEGDDSVSLMRESTRHVLVQHMHGGCEAKASDLQRSMSDMSDPEAATVIPFSPVLRSELQEGLPKLYVGEPTRANSRDVLFLAFLPQPLLSPPQGGEATNGAEHA
eukprot:gene4041-14120_t